MYTSFLPGVADPPIPSVDERDPYLRLQCVTIFVLDLERSLEFYLDRLGFSLVFTDRSESDRHWVAVAPPDGAAVMAIVAPDRNAEDYGRIGQSREVVFVTADVTAKFHEWSNRGVLFHHPPRPRTRGGVHTTYEDPDGNSFALVGFDAISREIESGRRATRPADLNIIQRIDAAIAEELESKRRAARELEIAKEVQARLFPQTLPPVKTLDYAGICIQARQVGGDYYDFLNLGRERLGLVIGDIAGKGIAAALLMANLQANLRSQCAIALREPERLLRSVNHLFYENTADCDYATLFFAEYDGQTRRLRYVNCGHLSGLLLRSDNTVEHLESTVTVVGLFEEWDCSIQEGRLFPGDMLALYTDGVTESFSDVGEEFGEQRLIQAMRRHRGQSSRDLVRSIVDEVQQFSHSEQHDDITLIIARCVEP